MKKILFVIVCLIILFISFYFIYCYYNNDTINILENNPKVLENNPKVLENNTNSNI